MITFHNNGSKVFVNKNADFDSATQSTTHLCVAAHEDDVEIMAYGGVLNCYQNPDFRFCGVCVTNGEGSPRCGKYADYSNAQMRAARAKEQLKASQIGDYSVQFLLDYSSAEVCRSNPFVIEDLCKIILATKPQIIYTHNIADRHPTHVAVALKTIAAIKAANFHPQKLYGCEVWRNLDWLCDCKVQQSTAGNDKLEKQLIEVFKTQIAGGKSYGKASIARRRVNATFAESHGVDRYTACENYIDLTSIVNEDVSVKDFISARLSNFTDSVLSQIDNLDK